MRFVLNLLWLSLWAAVSQAEPGLPAFILELPPTMPGLFVADTDNASMHHYSRTDDGVRLDATVYVSIGQRGVGKQVAGDRRTPLGVYFVVDRLDTSRLHEKYGVMAYPLDYPNVRDRQFERSGDGIWVHGVQPGSGRRPALDTDGCLALPNADLEKLGDDLVPLVTPVVIAKKMQWQDEATRERLREELRGQLARWTASYGAADRLEHESLYAADFSYRGLSFAEWRGIRGQGPPGEALVDVVMSDLLLLAEPAEPELYLSRFRLLTASDQQRRSTIKRLYWQRGADGVLRIVAEDNG